MVQRLEHQPAASLICRLLPTVAVLLVAGCGGFDPYNVIGRTQAAAPATVPVPNATLDGKLDPETRAAALDFVWRTVRERYYDPTLRGVDWTEARKRHAPQILAAPTDGEFWERLDKLTGELNDSHTRVHSPEQLERQRRSESHSLGLALREIAGAIHVTSVHPDSDAWYAGVRSGMRVVEIDRQDALAAVREIVASARGSSTAEARTATALARWQSQVTASGVLMAFQHTDGTRFESTLKPRVASTPPSVTARVLPSGHAYLRFSAWSPSLQSRVLAAIQELQSAPGMIIDLRGNRGGSAWMVEKVARRFFRDDQVTGKRLTRDGSAVTLAWGLYTLSDLDTPLKGSGDGAYGKPLVVLIDEGSASASEMFASGLQDAGRATLVGRRTCGCLLAYFGYAIVPGGGGLAYSEMGFRTRHDRVVEGVGVRPDIEVPLLLADLRENRDRALERAVAALQSAAPAARP